jgi:hypothetical protein
MPETHSVKRVAYSPAEFAELFGKSQTWGYRQIYSGKVTAITQHGRILIPAKDVEKILASAGIYNGIEKPKKAKERIESLTPEQAGIWQRYLKLRRESSHPLRDAKKGVPAPQKWKSTSRKSINARIAGAWGDKSAKP